MNHPTYGSLQDDVGFLQTVRTSQAAMINKLHNENLTLKDEVGEWQVEWANTHETLDEAKGHIAECYRVLEQRTAEVSEAHGGL